LFHDIAPIPAGFVKDPVQFRLVNGQTELFSK
jgi:hypothetical protein